MNLKNQKGIMNMKLLMLSLAVLSGQVIGLAFSQIYVLKGNIFCQTVQNTKPVEVALAKPVSNPPISQGGSVSTTGPENSLLRLKGYIKNIEDKNSFLQEKVGLLNSLLEAKDKEVTNLNKVSEELRSSLLKNGEEQNKIKTELEDKLASLSSQLIKKDAEIASLSMTKASLETEVQDLNKRLSELTVSYTTMKSSIQDKLFPMERELDSVKEGIKKQVEINDALNKNIASLSSELELKKKEKLDLGDEYVKLEISRKEVLAELEKVKLEKTESESQIAQLKQRISELNASYEEAKKSAASLSSTVSQKEVEKRDQLVGKDNELLGMKENISKIGAERDTLLMSVEDKDKLIRSLKDKLGNMESEFPALQKELSSQKERLAQTAEQLKRTVTLNNALKVRLKSIYAELELQRVEKNYSK
jgi:exonuclease SbcC